MLNRFMLFIIMFLCSVFVGLAQSGDDIMLKAMQDEIDRSMKELTLPTYDKPFFILYNVIDEKTCFINASLGSLDHSDDTPVRVKNSTRVLVGDYAFNDESLEDNLFSQSTALEIALPVDDDYFGIRRSFWSTTDKVYRDAAKHFAKHKETLKETGKALEEIPHRSFAKSNAVQILKTTAPAVFDKAAWEKTIRNLSALYLHHPSIERSNVILQYVRGYNYIVTSEGTTVKVPLSMVTLISVAQGKNGQGEFVMDRVMHQMKTPEQLPSEKELSDEIEKMITGIEALALLPKFTGEYTGPALFLGNAVPELFSNVFLRGRENIHASHAISRLNGLQYDQELTSMEGKIGKSILSESITVKAKPKLTSYKGTDLLGTFEVDNEGIVPAEELIVVQNGVLKNLLNDRTITHSSHTANGFASGAGVLEVAVSQKSSEKILREKLIVQAKKEGLDYAVIIRDEGMNTGLKIYKLSVTDGKEELVRNALPNENMKVLKHVLGASENSKAYNITLGRGLGNQGTVSFIVPEAILVEEMEIKPLRIPSLKEEEYVPNPLLTSK